MPRIIYRAGGFSPKICDIMQCMKRKVATHSQHFLRNPRFIAELVGHSNIRRGDFVLDIGAGSGAIAAVLARRCQRVAAYENEPRTLALLRRNMAHCDNVQIVAQDFLRARLPRQPYKVFANIPFSLSSKIITKLALVDNPPRAMYLIVQKQFAQKLVLDSPHFHSALGQALAPWWQARIRRPLRRSDFTPPPAVDTVLLELKLRSKPLLDLAKARDFHSFVYACYHDPRAFRRVYRGDLKPSQLNTQQWLACFSGCAR